MNISNIEKLANIMESKGLTSIEINEEGTSIKMERKAEVIMPPPVMPAHNIVPHIMTTPNATEETPAQETVVDDLKEIKSPTVGVFYSASSPESDSFVKVGTVIKKGDVLCIIEAMKLMNEIVSEMDGEVVEVCIGNGQVVEYGQVLFRVK